MKDAEKARNTKSHHDQEKLHAQQASQTHQLQQQCKDLEATLETKSHAMEKLSSDMTAVRDAVAKATNKLMEQQKMIEELRSIIRNLTEENLPVVELRENIISMEAKRKEEMILRKKYYNMYIQEKGNIRSVQHFKF